MSYNLSAEFYDLIYTALKDYKKEAEEIRRIIDEYLGKHYVPTLLDVACGTGLHMMYLQEHFEVTGIDLSVPQLDIASTRLPGVSLIHDDMRTFKLEERFSVVTCLFSAIGHMLTFNDLCKAIENMSKHLRSGGILIVEPWVDRDDYIEGTVHAQFVDTEEVKITRMNVSGRIGDIAILNLHHLFVRKGDSEPHYFVETLLASLFNQDQYRRAFKRAGLSFDKYSDGFMGRGLYVGIKK